jgi:alpha-mannosidase
VTELRDAPRPLPAASKERVPLELTAHCVRGEPIGYADAVHADFAPIKVGDAWGPPWSTTWFHVRGRVPDGYAAEGVVAVFDLGFDGPTGFTCEALAWKEGKPWRGVDPNHRWLPIEGRDIDFYLEAAANPRATEEGPEPSLSMIALRHEPEPAFVLRQAELAIRESPAEGIGMRIDPSHRITAVGHAHIDTAWEWPIREARRKVARSWSTQLALLDQYPDYIFAASQPLHYEWMKKSYPDIYRRVKEKVAAGRWEPVGAMWVEADCNLPSGESLVRQLLYGKRFFMHEFGYETRILWLPDVFGYPGNLPQLMAEAGCDFFLTQKLSWNDTNKPEHHTFIWEGIDGSRIFTHFPPADTYNGNFSPEEVEWSVRNFKDGAGSNMSLYLFGWGDGGGGPQAEMIDSAHRMGVELGRAADFFQTALAESHDLATLAGELYFELHRGTYTSQSRIKRLNRLAQEALRQAEMWSVAANTRRGPELEKAWKGVLINQFHDILPGSSIDWVYEEAERDVAVAAERATAVGRDAISSISGHGSTTTVFNATSHERRELIRVGTEDVRVVVPPCGWTVYVPGAAEPKVVVSERSLENELLRVEWDEHAVLTSIWDKEAEREVLSGPGNLLQLHDDNPTRWDAWDLDIAYRDSWTDLTEVSVIHRRSGLRAGIAFQRRFDGSSLVQTMSLDAGSRVIRFETEVEWRERHKILKVAFPVAVRSREATYEIQFGHLRRPTHEDDPRARAMFEVCAQRWADLSDGGYGVALLNDCKHGYDIHDSVMRLSLLRAPTHPDPNADQGHHRFTYALMPHPGGFREAGVIEAAEDLNSPLHVVCETALAPGTSRSLVEVDTREVIVEAIKKAEDSDAVIVRLYEAWGRSCHARVRTTLSASRAYLCDLLERNREELPVRDGVIDLDLTPFKILTLKLADRG